VKWFLAILLTIPGIAASAWALMLLVGVLHHEVSPAIPPIGYGSSLAIALAYHALKAINAAFNAGAQEVLK
jgi:hypothetical protein